MNFRRQFEGISCRTAAFPWRGVFRDTYNGSGVHTTTVGWALYNSWGRHALFSNICFFHFKKVLVIMEHRGVCNLTFMRAWESARRFAGSYRSGGPPRSACQGLPGKRRRRTVPRLHYHLVTRISGSVSMAWSRRPAGSVATTCNRRFNLP